MRPLGDCQNAGDSKDIILRCISHQNYIDSRRKFYEIVFNYLTMFSMFTGIWSWSPCRGQWLVWWAWSLFLWVCLCMYVRYGRCARTLQDLGLEPVHACLPTSHCLSLTSTRLFSSSCSGHRSFFSWPLGRHSLYLTDFSTI